MFIGRYRCDDIGCAHQLQGHFLRALFDFLILYCGGAVIGHRGAGDKNIAFRQQLQALLQHFFCALDTHQPRVFRCGEVYRAADQCSLCAGVNGRLRESVAHLSRAVVGNIAHRVKGLSRGTGCNDNAFACQFASCEQARGDIGNVRWRLHSAWADIATSLQPRSGTDDMHASLDQGFDIGHRCLVFPHLLVHRRRQHKRCCSRQCHGGQQVVGTTGAQARDKIGRRRCDQE